MAYEIINVISTARVPKWGNMHKFIAIHYLGVDGQNYDLAPDGTGAHFTIYWDGRIYQRCAYDAIVWQVGTAGMYVQKHPEARNANTIGIELCCHCDGNKQSAEDPKWYFTEETQNAAVWLVKRLMAELNIPISNVLRHFDIVNKTCPAPYVHNNRYKTSWTWEEFKAKISGQVQHLYRVRKSWDDAKSQTNAYYNLDLAKADADDHPGYSVYDETGKCVYTSKSSEYTPEEWIAMIAPIAKALQEKNGVLASVVIAQTCLETGFGKTDLTRRYNIVGMKSSLINSTWTSVWDGKIYTKYSPEYVDGQLVQKPSDFRVYHSFRECLEDYERFLLGVKNSKGLKYARIKGMTDPAEVIHVIRIGTGTDAKPEGYATDPAYETKVLNIIKQYNLTQYDNVSVVDKYQVSRTLDDKKHRLGLYHVLDNAKKQADENWGFKVWDIQTGKLVYEPKLAPWQKLCAEAVAIDVIVGDDIKDGKNYTYKNTETNKIAPTFDEARKTNNRKLNCACGVYWALLRAGVVPADRSAIQWYGSKGIVWVGKNAEKNAKKYFNIINVNETLSKAIKNGKIVPGDIITFATLSHVCIYIGNNLFYDTGHANCNGSGEGAVFKRFVGSTPYGKYKVAQIMRLK